MDIHYDNMIFSEGKIDTGFEQNETYHSIDDDYRLIGKEKKLGQ